MVYLVEALAAGAPTPAATPNSAPDTRHSAAPVEVTRERQPPRWGLFRLIIWLVSFLWMYGLKGPPSSPSGWKLLARQWHVGEGW